jgi:hypothetical protein
MNWLACGHESFSRYIRILPSVWKNNIMAFVNELIPEEQKAKFPFPVSTRPDGSKPTLWKWTIDRERDAYLVLINAGGGGHVGTPLTEYYILNWRGELIRFVGEPQVSGTKETGQVLSWRVYSLVISSTLEERKEEVLQLIRDALDAMGLLYKRDRVVAVNVEFTSPSVG